MKLILRVLAYFRCKIQSAGPTSQSLDDWRFGSGISALCSSTCFSSSDTCLHFTFNPGECLVVHVNEISCWYPVLLKQWLTTTLPLLSDGQNLLSLTEQLTVFQHVVYNLYRTRMSKKYEEA